MLRVPKRMWEIERERWMRRLAALGVILLSAVTAALLSTLIVN